MTILLPVTLACAAAAFLLNLWLGLRVGKIRMSDRISIGHGGHDLLERRMRAQANFIENGPLFVILLALVELGQGSSLYLAIVSALFVLARIAHAVGMESDKSFRLRGGGIMLNQLLSLLLAANAVWLLISAG